MRILIPAALAVFTVGLLGAGPAGAKWSCVGAGFVCGSPAKPFARSHGTAKALLSTSRRVGGAYNQHRGSKRRLAAHGGRKSPTSWSNRDKRLARAAARHGRSARRAARTPARAFSGGGSGQTGIASYYWQGQRVASGGRFNPNAMTAAHRTLPFGTKVRVTHVGSGRSVDVTINDRGPFVRGRVIDLSRAAAGVIGMRGAGLARVTVNVIGRN